MEKLKQEVAKSSVDRKEVEDSEAELHLQDPGDGGATCWSDWSTLQLRFLTPEEEIEEANAAFAGESSAGQPPAKRARVEDLSWLRTETFDDAFRSPGESGDLVFFRLNIVEGSQLIIKRQEKNVKHGLSLWAKAIQRLINTEEATFTPPLSMNPSNTGLTREEYRWLEEGLKHLERLTFSSTSGSFTPGQQSPMFLYKSGSSLKLCGVELYDHVNEVIVSVISRRGLNLGQCIVNLLIRLVDLGSALSRVPMSIPDPPPRRPPPPPPPTAHSIRTVKTSATLTAISRFSQAGAAMAVIPPPTPPVHPPVPPPRPAPPRFCPPMMCPAPPPAFLYGRNNTYTAEPPAVWVDQRVKDLPDWILSTLIDMVLRFNGQVVPSLDQHWYSTYGSQMNFEIFGFTGLHDALTSLPVSRAIKVLISLLQGVQLRHEGSEYWVQANGPRKEKVCQQLRVSITGSCKVEVA